MALPRRATALSVSWCVLSILLESGVHCMLLLQMDSTSDLRARWMDGGTSERMEEAEAADACATGSGERMALEALRTPSCGRARTCQLEALRARLAALDKSSNAVCALSGE